MDGFTGILSCGVPQNLNLAGLRVYLYVNQVDTDRRARARWVHAGRGHDGAAGGNHPRSYLFEVQF